MRSRVRRDHVFINCPFDQGYRAILDGIVFAIYDLGFVALCALEDDDGGEIRLSKIERIIEECGFGIHDLSAVAIDPATNLPRFNMPLELGLFLGCKRFGDEPQRKTKCLILDNDRYRYRNFISDVAGQDIHAHGGQAREAIIEVRNWLAGASGRKLLPGGAKVSARYERFQADLPPLRPCSSRSRQPHFVDFSEMVSIWLKADR